MRRALLTLVLNISLLVATAVVLATAEGAAAATVTKLYASGDLSLPIGPPGPIPGSYIANTTSDIEVPDVGTVVSARISVRLDYPVDSELDVSLFGPVGSDSVVTLASGAGGSGANFGSGAGCSGSFTVFDDAASTPIASGSAPFVGSFKPSEPLSALAGKPANGRWTLFILDFFPPTTGTLLCWQLELTIETPEAPVTETDLRVQATAAPKSVEIGKKLTYEFTVTNRGPGDATGVTLVDRLPRNGAFVGAKASQGACTRSGGRVRCELGDLATGASARVKITRGARTKAGRMRRVPAGGGGEGGPVPCTDRVTVRTAVRK